MAKKVLFLAGLFPAEIREEIIRNSKFNTQFAADALQWSFVKGLSFYYEDLELLNFPFLGSYPTLNKSPHVGEFAFGQSQGFHGLNAGYFNFIGLKNFSIYRRARKYLKNWSEQNDEEKVILIYSAFLPFLKSAIAAKKKNGNLKIYVILPDLPQFMGGPDNVLYRIFKRYTSSALQDAFEHSDGYVLLSKYMLERLPSENKKWTVVEGIYDPAEKIETARNEQPEKRTVLYTGTLAKRYGILGLLDAFGLIDDVDLQLVICGDGDSKEAIIAAGKKDKRIIYKGSLDRKEVLRMQRNASLLVNPRTPDGEFTKYSFPSKTMEYLASGVPALIFKLPGIPGEYYDYCFSLDDTSVESFAGKIKEILHTDPEMLAEKGKAARQFILDKKNPVVQCKRVHDLIEE
ncbi:MAG TPA: glycosyltransferase [Mucilaginibacter sp.]|nr:glycosyltransferase [Mucilaginibacter sp.]